MSEPLREKFQEEPKKKNPDDEIREALEKEGWQVAGMEYPFKTPLNSETGRFDPIKVLTDEQIKEKYINEYGKHGFTEVKAVPIRDPISGEPDERIVLIYMRKSERG